MNIEPSTSDRYKNRQEFAQELGMSARTMSRKLKMKAFALIPRCLLSPKEQLDIKKILEIELCPMVSKDVQTAYKI